MRVNIHGTDRRWPAYYTNWSIPPISRIVFSGTFRDFARGLLLLSLLINSPDSFILQGS